MNLATRLPRPRLSTALLLSGVLHAMLLAGLAGTLLHTPQDVPAPLQLQLQPAPAVVSPASTTAAAHGKAPVHTPGHSTRAAMTAPATIAAQAVPDSRPPSATTATATASPTASANTIPASTVSNHGEGSNTKQPATGLPEHQPALYRSAYLHNPEPPYPERSRELGEHGRVILQVRVSADGRALQVEVISGSHSRRLDEAARQAVTDWRFIPARQDGVAVESSLQIPITFALQSP